MNAGFVMAAIFAASAQSASWWSGASAVVSSNPSSSAIQGAIATGALGCAPVPVRQGLIVINLFNPVEHLQSAILVTPGGKEVDRIVLGAEVQSNLPDGPPVSGLFHGRLSPDGMRMAAFKVNPFRPDNRGPWVLMHLWVFDLEDRKGPQAALRPKIKNPSLAWSPDGSKLFVSEVDPEKAIDLVEPRKLVPMVSWFYDFKTRTKTILALPTGHEIVDISPDGKTLLTRTRPGQQWDLETGHVMTLDTLKPYRLAPQPFQPMRFTPDGKEVIGYRPGKKDNFPVPGTFVIASVASGLDRTIDLPAGAIEGRFACVSPDGKRMAYEWTRHEEPAPAPDGTERNLPPDKKLPTLPMSRVSVADFDGARAKTIFQCKDDQLIYGIDWR